MEIYRSDFQVMHKEDRSPVTIADTTSGQIIAEALRNTGLPVICEEEAIPDWSQRKNSAVWLVDPLDGTKEFIKKNGEFCICIALVEDHQPVFGFIASPVSGEVLYGGKNTGVYLTKLAETEFCKSSDQLKLIPDSTQKGLAYSRSHFSPKVSGLIRELEKEYGELNIIKKGSALKFFDLALGRAHFYPRMAPTMEWDIAAGQAIFEALGGEVIDFTNFEPLQYNKKSLYNPHFIARVKGLNLPNIEPNE